MNAGADVTPRALRIDAPLSARAVLDHFNENGLALLGADQEDAVRRIAQVLAHEADLSAAWGGLPGTDHPCHWQDAVGDEAAMSDRRSGHRRLDVHLPLWWALPLAVRDRQPCRATLPLGADHATLEALVRRHLPPSWSNDTVQVALDVETRVYWGARGAVHRQAAARQACAQRGDAGRPSLRLMTLRAGRAVETALPGRPVDPDVVLAVHPGVGWLVAVPVLRFEREPDFTERLRIRAGRWWSRMRGRLGSPSQRDRDPTFEARLKADEHWWVARLGIAPNLDRGLARDGRRGGSLRPASRIAARPGTPGWPAQVILIHGGLSSACSGFEAVLDKREPAASAVDDAAPVWLGLPALDERATWRFEHDTFLRVATNVRHLVDGVRAQCIEPSPEGAERHIVLLAHSRGGNVARFGLTALRKAFGDEGWTFAAVTLGSPHLGTQVFERVGHRWHGLASAVGGLRHLGSPWIAKATLAELVNLERGLAYDIPAGFHDVEPAGVERMMRGRPATDLPAGMWLVGSHWGPGAGLPERNWDWLFEDLLGAEEEGDGLVRRFSALGGRAACAGAFDASPVFHTHYLVHEPTRAQVARMLEQALAYRGIDPFVAAK